MWRATWMAILAIGTSLAAAGPKPDAAATSPPRLAIDGRANAHASIAARGDVVAVAWQASAAGAGDIYLAVSRDGGASFGAPVQVNDRTGEARNGGEMPPRVALVTASAAAADPDVVVVWRARTPTTSIRYARSSDGGRTFAAAATLQAPEAVGERGWQNAAVAPDGRVHAVWLDHRGLAKTSDGGAATHAHHRQGAAGASPAPPAPIDGAIAAQRSGFYYAALDASGAAAERELSRGVCYCCKTAIAAGPQGALYAAWRHVYEGNIRDIAFVASRDGGRSFGAPARVSEDRWQLAGCPDDGPSMAVDPGGIAHIVWPTVIGGDQPQGALFYAAMRDGHAFGSRVRVPTLGSPRPSHPQVTLVDERRLALAWDETLDGVRRSILSVATTSDGAPAFSAPVVLDDSPSPLPSAYPAIAATSTHIVSVWTSGPGDASVIGVRRVPIAAAAGSR